MLKIIWSDYLKYRANLRGFDLNQIEEIVQFSPERYYDTETSRLIAVGTHDQRSSFPMKLTQIQFNQLLFRQPVVNK
jgi:hypothetical protein